LGVQKKVFSSNAERVNYYKLRRAWGIKHAIYHNLPFLNVFSMDGLLLNETEKAGLKKTSVDYTLCDDNDSPLISIEFDGLQRGVNIGSTYYPSTTGPTPEWRQWITDLKLRVAHNSKFPHFVVWDDHFEDLSATVKLTIVDGIIGEVLTRKAVEGQLSRGLHSDDVGWPPEDFDALDRESQHEIVQDWVTGVEVAAALEINPISKTAARLKRELDVHLLGFSCEPKTLPELTRTGNLEERVKELDSVLCQGAKVVIETPDFGPLDATVMLPNFKTPGFGIGLELAEDIATIIICEKLRKLRTSST
jgi:hypothetical protein